jgi:hypothetical protein
MFAAFVRVITRGALSLKHVSSLVDELKRNAAYYSAGADRDAGELLARAAEALSALTAARRLAKVETIEQQDSASNMFNKCARTFAVQVER